MAVWENRVELEDFKGAVEDQGELGESFDIKTSVKQGCNMSGFFVLDCYGLGNEEESRSENGIGWKLFTSKLDDLDSADDVVLISSTKQQIQDKIVRMDTIFVTLSFR